LTKHLSVLCKSYNNTWKRKANDFSKPYLIVSHFQHPLVAVLGSGLALTNSSACSITPLFYSASERASNGRVKTKRSDAFPNPPFLPKHITHDNDLNDQHQHHPPIIIITTRSEASTRFLFLGRVMRCKTTNIRGHPASLHRLGWVMDEDNTGFPFDFTFTFASLINIFPMGMSYLWPDPYEKWWFAGCELAGERSVPKVDWPKELAR
jgi:hypothetical protein